MLPPDAVRKGAFKRKGPSIAIVIGGPAKRGPSDQDEDMDEEKDEPKKGYGVPKNVPCEECECSKCGHMYDPADAKNDDMEEEEDDEDDEAAI